MDVGYACFYGADDDAAAGCDGEDARYRSVDRAGKGPFLTELVELIEWHRDYTRAVLRGALTLRVVKPRAGRAPTYGLAATKALMKCWAVLREPAGKRLAPMLGLGAAAAPR